MATAKKTTSPAAKKAAPATPVVAAKKAPVAKVAAPATPVVAAKKAAPVAKKAPVAKVAKPKFKPGQAVIGTSAQGVETTGRFAGIDQTDRGEWVNVNIGAKGKPAVIKRYRPKAVRAA